MPKTQLLTKEQIEKMKNEFLQLDLDNDGTITVDELGNCLRSMRSRPPFRTNFFDAADRLEGGK